MIKRKHIVFMLIFISLLNFRIFSSTTDENTIKNNAKMQTIQNMEVTKELIDWYLKAINEYRKKILQANELLEMGSNKIYAPEDRAILINNLHKIFDEAKTVITETTFNGFKIFSDTKNKKDFTVTLCESEPTEKINFLIPYIIDNEDIFVKIMQTIKSTSGSFSDSLKQIKRMEHDTIFLMLKITHFRSRLNYAINLQKIFIDNVNNSDKIFKEKVNENYKKMLGRMFEISTQSANGIYNNEDRKQLQIEYNELLTELKREEKISGIKCKLITLEELGSIDGQNIAEREMLKLTKIFN